MNKTAFTLIEAITVIAIIATIAAILAPAILAAKKNADHVTLASPEDPPESWSLCTVKHGGHWYVVGNHWGAHSPACPCLPKSAEAE